MPETTEVMKVSGLAKVYGKGSNAFAALGGVDLSLTKGESVAVVGKSGSGKSTLMHLMALMDKPTAGVIHVDGHDTSTMKGKALDRLRNRTFGFVFQQFFLNGNSSVLENVILPLKIAGKRAGARKKRGLEVLEAVGLTDKAHNKANNLSGGQKQRVVIARALVNNPSIVFADEPTGNLDSVTGEAIEQLLFTLNKERGVTLVIVTHDEELASKCDRQIVLKDGKILRTSGGRAKRAVTAGPIAKKRKML